MLRILKKRFLVEIKAKYFFIGAKMRGVETGFAGPGVNSANPEDRRSFLRGLWRLCTPSLVRPLLHLVGFLYSFDQGGKLIDI